MITAIQAGLRYDAVDDFLVLPEGMDLEEELKLMCAGYPVNHCTKNFAEWLIERGARRATEAELKVFAY